MSDRVVFAELAAGTAAVSLVLGHGPAARPFVGRMGAKTGYAEAVLDCLGLRPGQGADRYIWAEPEPFAVELLRARFLPTGDVVAWLTEWSWREPRELFAWLAAEDATEWSIGQRVARALLLSRWAYRGGLPASGFNPAAVGGRPKTATDHGAKARTSVSESGIFEARVRHGFEADTVTLLSDARLVEPGTATHVYIDPPYRDTTGYGKERHDEPDWVRLALDHANAGAVVAYSEGYPVEALASRRGWDVVDVTDRRSGQARTFSRSRREVVTRYRPGT